ncbi:hypothetical protein Xinn_02306 [Xenorhabdus innexi]|uniref:Uncharacterized protein n=1 Tax=Xenorhabdus innexi TaxID=290109 RepID=A0A2G0NFS3_9GAMM|nr:hypothetical protein Xinn_02306 [Xenorhabdus innexi]
MNVWIKSLFNIIPIIALFIVNNMGFISIELTIKEVITIWPSHEYSPDELHFLIDATDYVMLTNNFLFIFCIIIFFFRNKLKYSLQLIFSAFLISIINNAVRLIYILNFSVLLKFIKVQSLNFIFISFPVSIVIIYILARVNLHKK